jgi:hypothetical protein
MKKVIGLTTFGAAVLIWAQAPAAKFPNGTLGAQTAGRMIFHPQGTTELYGYYTFLEGVDAAMFNGQASTRNAHFTFRTEHAGVEFVRNGVLAHMLVRPLNILGTATNVYYDPTPDQDFSRPESFTDGELIATYRARGSRATIGFGTGGSGSLTLVLESSKDVTIGGTAINLRNVVQQLYVNIVTPAPASFEEFLSLRGNGGFAIPFGGVGYIGNE